MPSKRLKSHLADEISVWFADGLIDSGTMELLRERYDVSCTWWGGIVKHLSRMGGVIIFFGIMGFVAAMAESAAMGVLLLGAAAGGMLWYGLNLAGDITNRQAHAAGMMLVVGAFLGAGEVVLVLGLLGVESEAAMTMLTGLICLPCVMWLAYKAWNTQLLVLALIGLFHWVGSWHGMFGRSTYGFSVEEPLTMAGVAVLAVAVGIYHERRLYPRTGGFYKVWENVGLLYFNMSLLILSISGGQDGGNILLRVGLFTLGNLAQIVAGAALHSEILRGFGVTFLAVNIFTRYFEMFWDELDIGLFMAGGGILLAILGGLTEMCIHIIKRKVLS